MIVWPWAASCFLCSFLILFDYQFCLICGSCFTHFSYKQTAQFDTWLSHLFITHCFVFISTKHIPIIQYVFNQAPWGSSQSTYYCLVRQGVRAGILKSTSPAAGKIDIFIIWIINVYLLWTYLCNNRLTLGVMIRQARHQQWLMQNINLKNNSLALLHNSMYLDHC